MNRLFVDVYLDEDVSVVLADMLKARGFRATTTRDADHLGATDEEQLRYAAGRGMALLTHNRVDFEVLHRRYLVEDRQHWGILIAARRRPGLIAEHMLRLLNRLTADEMRNQLLYA